MPIALVFEGINNRGTTQADAQGGQPTTPGAEAEEGES
jgi:hypothetical protein